MAVAHADLLDALAAAFAYPACGIDDTLVALRNLEAPARSGFDAEIDAVFAARGEFADVTEERLAYTRLFIGSFRMEAPPYASYYLDPGHLVAGPSMAEIRDVYRAFGVELGAGEKDPADHLRYLLEFLALLSRRYEETGQEAFAEAYIDFRDAYVNSWIGQFAALVDTHVEHEHYRLLVALTMAVLEARPKLRDGR